MTPGSATVTGFVSAETSRPGTRTFLIAGFHSDVALLPGTHLICSTTQGLHIGSRTFQDDWIRNRFTTSATCRHFVRAPLSMHPYMPETPVMRIRTCGFRRKDLITYVASTQHDEFA